MRIKVWVGIISCNLDHVMDVDRSRADSSFATSVLSLVIAGALKL